MIEIIGVTKIYGRKTALNNINLTLPNKGLVLISGENGSGKTTLVNLIGALDIPTEGTIQIGELTLTKSPEKNCASIEKKTLDLSFKTTIYLKI